MSLFAEMIRTIKAWRYRRKIDEIETLIHQTSDWYGKYMTSLEDQRRDYIGKLCVEQPNRYLPPRLIDTTSKPF